MHGVTWAFSGRQGMCTVDDRDHRSHRVCVHELTGVAQEETGKDRRGQGKTGNFQGFSEPVVLLPNMMIYVL